MQIMPDKETVLTPSIRFEDKYESKIININQLKKKVYDYIKKKRIPINNNETDKLKTKTNNNELKYYRKVTKKENDTVISKIEFKKKNSIEEENFSDVKISKETIIIKKSECEDLYETDDESIKLNNENFENMNIFTNKLFFDETRFSEFVNHKFLTKLQKGQNYNPATGFLLASKKKVFEKKKCLILDLDETLVHSSFKYTNTADFVILVEIDDQIHRVYVIKRPGVDKFLKKVSKWYEVVLFTASILEYGNSLLDKLDMHNCIHHRLFRDSCYLYQGNFVKNLSQIGRPLNCSIIIDNSPSSYIFHQKNSIPISSWFDDEHDNELIDLLPLLKDLSNSRVNDVSLVLDFTI